MADGTLMNFVTVDYMSEADMELALVRWTDNRERYLPELTSRGMLRFTVLKIWNRQGIYRLGFWYEYRDPEPMPPVRISGPKSSVGNSAPADEDRRQPRRGC